jgi:hypothetical protein
MNRILFGLVAGVACLVGLAGAGEANAAVVRKTTTVVTKRPFHAARGVRFKGGYHFAGRSHQWAYKRGGAAHGRYIYRGRR